MHDLYLDQGSDDWLGWRAGHEFIDLLGVKHASIGGPRITATTGSVCGGHSPFNTPHKLWGEMLGLRKRETADYAMLRGSAMEPVARKAYNKIVGEEYEPICIESSISPWIAASLDGRDMLMTRGVEIKCPISPKTHDMALMGEVPVYYYDQIQWQMLASDNQLKEIDYFSFAPKFGVAQPIVVKVDLVRQAELVAEAIKFRLAVITGVAMSGTDFEQAGKTYLVLNRRLKALEIEVEVAKSRIKKLADGKPTQGGGVIVTVSNTDGRTSWEKVANEIIEKYLVPEDYVNEVKLIHKGKASSTISVKEGADADAIYAEILISSEKPQVLSFPDEIKTLNQPNPSW
jgi:putative phage-type endonuclease